MPRMRRRLVHLGVALGLVLAGCGDDDEPVTPAACLGGADAYLGALANAPDAVTLDGTPIGACLTEEQPAGQIATVGEAMVAAATELNDRARSRPLGEPPVQLGYLVGAVRSRAEQTAGIHEDLARRVESAAAFLPGDQVLPGGYQQRYEEGLTAGRASG